MKENLPLLKNRGYYPECYVPPKLLRVFEGDVNELVEESRPQLLEKEPKNILSLPQKPKFDDAFTALIMLCSVGLFFHLILFTIAISLLFISGCILFLVAKKNYPRLLKGYEKEVLQFNEAKQLFQTRVEEHQKELKIYNEQINSHAFLSSLIVKYINKTFTASLYPSVAVKAPRKGRSELFFEQYLIKYFGDGILKDCTIEIFQYLKRNDDFEYFDYDMNDRYVEVEKAFVPDFCFIHPSKALKIDIEIDEPYASKKPIHFFGEDNARNNYFVNKNWLVLRFSEQQVLGAPNECCREIAEIVHDYTNDASYISKLAMFGRLPRLKKWREEEVGQFMTENLRLSYVRLEASSIDFEMLNGSWDCEDLWYDFNGLSVIKTVKSSYFKESLWKKTNGIFYIITDNLNRSCITILWENNIREILIIDHLTSSNLIITNMYTRNIYSMTLTKKDERIARNILYNAKCSQGFTIAEVKKKFGYVQLQMRLANNIEGKTEYHYHYDNEKAFAVFIHRKLANKIKSEPSYDKIILGKPFFVKVNQSNRIGVELQDLDKLNNK